LLLKEDIDEENAPDKKKILIAVGVVALIGLGFYLYKQNKN
jgi:hypothetical protein